MLGKVTTLLKDKVDQSDEEEVGDRRESKKFTKFKMLTSHLQLLQVIKTLS